jgi:hypothetical protein
MDVATWAGGCDCDCAGGDSLAAWFGLTSPIDGWLDDSIVEGCLGHAADSLLLRYFCLNAATSLSLFACMITDQM